MAELSLSELKTFDAHSMRKGTEQRFCCPLPACAGKPVNASHRSLTVNIETGAWNCKRCGEKGKLQEYHTERPISVSSRRERSARELQQWAGLSPSSSEPGRAGHRQAAPRPDQAEASTASGSPAGSASSAPSSADNALLGNVTFAATDQAASVNETSKIAPETDRAASFVDDMLPGAISASSSAQTLRSGAEAAGRHGRQSAQIDGDLRAASVQAGAVETASGSQWREAIRGLLNLPDTLAATYLQGRGLSVELGQASGARYHPKFYGRPALLFPIRNASGELVAVQGRYVDGSSDPKARTAGKLADGAFWTPGALDALTSASGSLLVICEAPIDALSLAACGLPALALCGTTLRPWMLRRCIVRSVRLAFDADEAGDKAAAQWFAALTPYTSNVKRLRPVAGKDWNEILTTHGPDTLRAFVAALDGVLIANRLPISSASSAAISAASGSPAGIHGRQQRPVQTRPAGSAQSRGEQTAAPIDQAEASTAASVQARRICEQRPVQQRGERPDQAASSAANVSPSGSDQAEASRPGALDTDDTKPALRLWQASSDAPSDAQADNWPSSAAERQSGPLALEAAGRAPAGSEQAEELPGALAPFAALVHAARRGLLPGEPVRLDGGLTVQDVAAKVLLHVEDVKRAEAGDRLLTAALPVILRDMKALHRWFNAQAGPQE